MCSQVKPMPPWTWIDRSHAAILDDVSDQKERDWLQSIVA